MWSSMPSHTPNTPMLLRVIQKWSLPSLLLAAVLSLFFGSYAAHAADASKFDPGYIMSDSIFYDGDAMSASDIQSFLSAKVTNCDTNGAQRASEYGSSLTRAQYAASRGWSAPPYTCIKDYVATTTQKTPDRYCDGYTAGNESAATILYKIGRSCGINPKVLIVLLQKEQGLITDIWPLASQYRSATGYGCPDTAACDSQYYGFFNQVYNAARQFKLYRANPTSYSYVAQRNNTIRWNPQASCGNSTVYIQNQATAGLYNYTPYRPNDAALNAGYGTGNGCSAYGNRNFWLYFTDWFGSTHEEFSPQENARWMKTAQDIRKVNIYTGQPIDDVIPAGTVIYFPQKITIDGVTYLRSQNDLEYRRNKGIPLSALTEYTPEYTALKTPRWIETKKDVYKYDPVTKKITSGVIKAGTKIYINDKLDLGIETYIRTFHDSSKDINGSTLKLSELKDSPLVYKRFQVPRYMELRKNVGTVNLQTFASTAATATSYVYFSYKIDLNGVAYAYQQANPSPEMGIKLSDLKEVTPQFTEMVASRYLQTTGKIYKKNPISGANTGQALANNQKIYFSDKFEIDGKIYLRTQHDSERGNLIGILLSELRELP